MCFGRAFRPASGVAQVSSSTASQVFGILGSNAAFDSPKSERQPVTPTRRTNPTTDLWSVMGRKFARHPQAPQCFPPHSLVDFDLNGKPIANRRVLQVASPLRYDRLDPKVRSRMLSPSRSGVISFGSFQLDPEAGSLTKHGVRVRLPRQPARILKILAQRAGEVVTREELRDELWGSDTFVDFEHGLNAGINKLRQMLGDSAEKP